MRTEVVTFRKTIPPNTTDVLAERVKENGYVEQVYLRFYRGQEMSLEVTPFVEHKGRQIDHFFTYPSTAKEYLTGDDDEFSYPVTLPIEYDDFLKVKVRNKDLEYEYDLVVDMIIRYEGDRSK